MTERELFKEAVMQYIVDDTRVQRVSKKRKTHPVARKILFAAACLLIALSVTVFAIPSARAAVEEWINGWFSARDYFGQEKTERTKEPTIEAIITSAGENGVTVTNVGEGYEAYANAFDMALDEIAYDGTSIYISGTMSGATARPFVQAYTGGDTFRAEKYDGSLGDNDGSEYYYFACENNVTIETADGNRYSGELVPTFTPEMDEFCQSLTDSSADNVFKDGELVSTNPVADAFWNKYLTGHDVRFSIELQNIGPVEQPLSGQVTGELSIRMRYDNVDSKDPVQVLNASFGSITIDADAYLSQTQTTQAQEGTRVDLGGIHPVSINEWQAESEQTSDDCETYMYTHELNFAGASVSLKEISFTPTDTKITLHVVLPETWTAAERCYCPLYFQFLLDGEETGDRTGIPFNVYGPIGTGDQTDATLEYDFNLWESTLSPSQWAAAKTLTIIPSTTYWWDMKVCYDNGPQQDVSLRDGAVYTGIVNHTGYEFDTLYDQMTQYALTINLDDYR